MSHILTSCQRKPLSTKMSHKCQAMFSLQRQTDIRWDKTKFYGKNASKFTHTLKTFVVNTTLFSHPSQAIIARKSILEVQIATANVVISRQNENTSKSCEHKMSNMRDNLMRLHFLVAIESTWTMPSFPWFVVGPQHEGLGCCSCSIWIN